MTALHYPDPTTPSGLRWHWSWVCREWQLRRADGRLAGIISRSTSRRSWQCTLAGSWVGGDVLLRMSGTLSDCARALVEAVRRG